MTSQETASYITHHLKLAGRADILFSDVIRGSFEAVGCGG
jgi:type II secretory pathway predicted ATPase ExeA